MRFCNVVWTAMVVGLLGGVLLLSGCGQKVAAPEPFTVITGAEPRPPARVSLSGMVLDQAGNPVSGVWVTLGTKRVESGADGSYTFTGLLPGTYQVFASSGGYIAAGAGFIVGTTDRTGADITMTSLASLPRQVEGMKGTETVEISEGVTVGTKAIVPGVPVGELTVEEKKALFPATLVVEAGAEIKNAAGNVVTEAPDISVTYLERSQCPLPSTRTFGMKPTDVVKSPGTKQTATTEIVIEGVRTPLTVEAPNELLSKGTVVEASNVPFAGFVLEGNGEQGWTFDEPQLFIVNPANMTPPADLSGLEPGTQIPFVDSEGKVTYATLRQDGSIELPVSKLTTYMMQVNFKFEVTSSEFEVSERTGAAKPAAPQIDITASTEYDPVDEVLPVPGPVVNEALRNYLIDLVGVHFGIPTEVLIGDIEIEEIEERLLDLHTVVTIYITVYWSETESIALYMVVATVYDGSVTRVEGVFVVHTSGGAG